VERVKGFVGTDASARCHEAGAMRKPEWLLLRLQLNPAWRPKKSARQASKRQPANERNIMKQSKSIRSKGTLAVLALVMAPAIPSSAELFQVPADYSTIQAAVDAAASGDEIQIGPGVYTNQVVIAYKNLTLSGSPGTILRATPNMERTLDPYTGAIQAVPLVGIFKSTNVVSGLTFEGERLGDTQTTNTLNGINFFAAGGRVENCRFMGFRGDTLKNGLRWGVGVHVLNPDEYGGGLVNVDVVRNTFADNAVSIQLIGDAGPGFDPTLLRTTFTVEDNIITGIGPDANGRQVGIQIYAGASGEVKRNTMSDHAYIGTNAANPFSYGILASDDFDFPNNPLAALQPIHFEGNIFRSNQVDMVLFRGDGSTIVYNSFEGAGPGTSPTGLVFSGDNVPVATNRFSDMETGILLLGNDQVYGTYLGIASNAVLTANGFCNVATNYVYEPLTTHTEQDTLECPWPMLDIRAVQLSWPFPYTGYSVETSPAAEGPWSALDATPSLQDGQNSVVVPADSDQQFFRLKKP